MPSGTASRTPSNQASSGAYCCLRDVFFFFLHNDLPCFVFLSIRSFPQHFRGWSRGFLCVSREGAVESILKSGPMGGLSPFMFQATFPLHSTLPILFIFIIKRFFPTMNTYTTVINSSWFPAHKAKPFQKGKRRAAFQKNIPRSDVIGGESSMPIKSQGLSTPRSRRRYRTRTPKNTTDLRTVPGTRWGGRLAVPTPRSSTCTWGSRCLFVTVKRRKKCEGGKQEDVG